MSSKIRLVFSANVRGHYLEYIHHIYDEAANKEDEQFVFVVPEDFQVYKTEYKWKSTDSISFLFITENEYQSCRTGSVLKTSWHIANVIKKYARITNATDIILFNLMGAMPWLGHVLSSSIRVSGIVYENYLYADKANRWQKRLKDYVYFHSLASRKVFQKVFVLNDEKGINLLNEKFHTTKFAFLPDPFMGANHTPKNLRENLGIDKDKFVFLHLGVMTDRKGTLDILKAAKLLSTERKAKSTFIFSGRVRPEVKDEFYRLVDELKDELQIIVLDKEFSPYERFLNLSYTADCILIPYKNVNMSSGIIGYAAYYHKPVIAPAEGLLGALVHDNNLGTVIQNLSIELLADELERFVKYETDSDEYNKKTSIDAFAKIILR